MYVYFIYAIKKTFVNWVNQREMDEKSIVTNKSDYPFGSGVCGRGVLAGLRQESGGLLGVKVGKPWVRASLNTTFTSHSEQLHRSVARVMSNEMSCMKMM